MKKNQHLLIFENFGEKVDFLLFFREKFLGNRQTQKQISKMNTKVHENNFRNLKCVNIYHRNWLIFLVLKLCVQKLDKKTEL